MLRQRLYLFVLLIPLFTCCKKHNSRIYTSECANNTQLKKVSYRNLMDSLQYYQNRYVQVSGEYRQGKELSALVSDSSSFSSDSGQSLWVNFVPDCPLFEKHTHVGLFQSTDGEYLNFDKTRMVIGGRLEMQKTKARGVYRPTLNNVCYVELK